MRDITISLDEKIIKAGREYARQRNTTLNDLIRSLLEQTVMPDSKNWLEVCFELMDRAQANSRGTRWKRESLYSRR